MGYREEGKWWVAPANYTSEVVGEYRFSDNIEILDTTLRDGEQQPGIVLTKDDKVKIAKKLAEVGVQRIETGTPAVSEADANAIREIVQLDLPSKIYCFCRSMASDMELAKSVGVDGVLCEMIGSEHMLRFGKKWERERAVKAAIEGTQAAHALGLQVSLFLADASRADLQYLLDFIREVEAGGHIDSLVLADTMGTFSPEAAKFTVRTLIKNFAFPIECHFHSDYDLGVATTLAGLSAGASVAHVTVNGIGERAGSPALESVVVALEALYGRSSGIKLDKLKGLSDLVAELTGFPISPIKPIVGDHIFSWDTGLPSSLWLNAKDVDPMIMLPYHYKLTGRNEPELLLGKKSGKDNLKVWLNKIHVTVSEERERDLLDEVKKKSLSMKRNLKLDEFKELVDSFLNNEARK